MRRMQAAAAAVAASLVLIGLTGASASGRASTAKALKPDPNGTLRLAVSITPSTWNPLSSSSDAVGYHFLSPLYDQLFRFDSKLDVVPSLAESYTVTSDRKSITIKLRKGVVFQDGAPFNAAAVVANMNYGKSLNSPLNSATYATISSVTAVDESTVRIDGTGDMSTLPLTMAFKISVGGMVSPKVLAENPGSLTTKPVGSGPFKLASQTSDRAIYEKASSYWDTKLLNRLPRRLELIGIADDNARLSALQAGQIDATGLLAPVPNEKSIVDGKTIKSWKSPTSNRILYSLLNYNNPALANPKVRQALSLAIDRQAIAKTVTLGACNASVQPFVKGGTGYNAAVKVPKADPARAKRMLADAGFPNLTLKGLFVNGGIFSGIATAVQAQLAQAGVTISLEPVNASLSQSTWRSGAYDLNFGSSNGSPDPAQIIGPYYTKNPTFQPFGEDPALTAKNAAAAVLQYGSPARDKAYQELAKYQAANPVLLQYCVWPPQVYYRANVLGVQDQGWGQITTIWDARAIAIAKS